MMIWCCLRFLGFVIVLFSFILVMMGVKKNCVMCINVIKICFKCGRFFIYLKGNIYICRM